ncbi:MAG: hypothetical protein AAGH99_15010 [Planctomycetota bacterium]
MPKAKKKKKKQKTKKAKLIPLATVRAVAAEDLRVGDGVAVSCVTAQFLACEDPPPGETHNRVLKADFIPADAGDPLRIVAVCLPFVLAVNVARQYVTIDVRRQHLVKLDAGYTKRAMKKLGEKRSLRLR